VLVDSPGFDDSDMQDFEVLDLISKYLACVYQTGKKLKGVIYLYAIDEVRFSGISRRNFHVFRQLCGQSTMVNVLIVTTKWDMTNHEMAVARETQLSTSDQIFKPAIEKGARLLRHDNTRASAHSILYALFPNKELPLKIQREIVDEHKDLGQTSAGVEVDRELREQAKQHAETLRALEEKYQAALKARDEETQKEMAAEKLLFEEKIAGLNEEITKLQQRKYAELLSAGTKMVGLGVQVYGERESRLAQTRAAELALEAARAAQKNTCIIF